MRYLAAVIALLLAVPAARADEPPDPQPIHKGDPAPADGVFLVPARAAIEAGAFAREKTRADGCEQLLRSQPPPVEVNGGGSTTVVAVVAFTLGIAAGAYAVIHFSK